MFAFIENKSMKSKVPLLIVTACSCGLSQAERDNLEGSELTFSAADYLARPLQRTQAALITYKSGAARELRNPFSAAAGVSRAPIPRAALHAAQSVDSALREACPGSVQGVLVTHCDGIAWTSLAEVQAARLALWQARENAVKGPSTLVPGARWEGAPVGAASGLVVLLWAPAPSAAASLPLLFLDAASDPADEIPSPCLVLCHKQGGPIKCIIGLRSEAVERRGSLVLASVLANAAEKPMARLYQVICGPHY